MHRGSGILFHISSLPSPFGIGTMGKEAYLFVDFLKKSGMKYWQILPIGPTGYGDSPYQSFSAFAGNPYFIDLDRLTEEGSLSKSDYTGLNWGSDPEHIDYSLLFTHRFQVLKLAWKRDQERLREKIESFKSANAFWLTDYAMYMALKGKNGQNSYQKWEKDLKCRQTDALASASFLLKDEMEFWIYVQYQFFRQWNALKSYAGQNGIQIIGDIPIYVAEDSADTWAHSEIFQLDENRVPRCVAGCPPDYFSVKGQLWGNPLYDWNALKKTNYAWWIARIRFALSVYDIVRIDHFRAFSAYYSIPYGRTDAIKGKWVKGPGNDFFQAVKNVLGDPLPIIAEDLGTLDDGVKNLLKETGFPGMRVVQFGMHPGENSEYLPHNYSKNTVAYIGTHDNDTLRGWLEKEPVEIQNFAREYMRSDTVFPQWGFIQTMLASPADVVIFTMQDLLALGSDARINTPSTLNGNWQWRIKDMQAFDQKLAQHLLHLCQLYSR